SALTRSRSAWSMTAMSPGFRRRTSVLVRWSTRAVPATPLDVSARPRVTRGNFTDGTFIGLYPARARRLPPSQAHYSALRGVAAFGANSRWGPRGLRAYGGLRDWCVYVVNVYVVCVCVV